MITNRIRGTEWPLPGEARFISSG